MQKGKITPNGVMLHIHENAAVVFLTEQGFGVIAAAGPNKGGTDNGYSHA